jgi:hypothetical protein
MSIAFTAFFAWVLGERLGERVGRAALLPLLSFGVGSVLFWAATLSASPGGDLRAYVLVKYLPPAITLLLLTLVPAPRRSLRIVLATLLLFGLASAFELLDAAVYRTTGGIVSGHTLKHLVAAVATAVPLLLLPRRPAPAAPPP